MTFQENRIIASIFSFLLAFGIYFGAVLPMHANGRFDAGDGNSLLGQAILILIVGTIVLNIIVTIVFTIVMAIIKQERDPSLIIDERERMMELRGEHISTCTTGIGFVVAMAVLALGHSTFLVFNLIVAAFGLGALAANLTMLHLHRRGF